MKVFLKATQLYDEVGVWSNLTFKLAWEYKTVVDRGAPVGVFKSFSFTQEWIRDVKYGFLVFPEGDISKATTENPVPANFSLQVYIDAEKLNVKAPLMLTGIERSYEGSLKASSELAGRLMFISPTAAIITAITKTRGETIREEWAKESQYSLLFKVKLPLIEFYRKIHGYNEWPRWTYKAVDLQVRWNPGNMLAP
ncbi:MAG: hypothetical protein P3X22_007970 [Thermoprotei archaeon]|nr:hypothetical protein [Thermoprotei archaeon]